MSEKVVVDVSDLTLGELTEVGELLGMPLHEIMQSPRQPDGIAAVICVQKRRDDPSYTLDDARRVKMKDVDMRDAPDPEVAAGGTGDAPSVSPASGS